MFRDTSTQAANEQPASAGETYKKLTALSFEDAPEDERRRAAAAEERAAFNYILRVGLIVGASATSLVSFAFGVLTGWAIWHHG